MSMLKSSFPHRPAQAEHICCIASSFFRIKTFSASASPQPRRAIRSRHCPARYTQATRLQAIPTTGRPILPSRRAFTTTANLLMASDEDYMAFLNKANQDPNEGFTKSASSGKHEFKTTDSGVQVPAVLKTAVKDAFYVSDADEPFVPVCLKWDEGGQGLPDEVEFAKLISHPDPSNAQIEIQDPADWDTQGQYGEILDAVREAGKGNDVRVYRITKDGARVEYWVVTTEGKGKDARLVGVKALAIES